MRDCLDRRVTPPMRVTFPTWGPPPPLKQALSRKPTSTCGFRDENSRLFQERHDTWLILGKLSSAVKNKIFTRFQLFSSQYPRKLVRITNKLVLKERSIDSTLWFTVIALLTSVARAAFHGGVTLHLLQRRIVYEYWLSKLNFNPFSVTLFSSF